MVRDHGVDEAVVGQEAGRGQGEEVEADQARHGRQEQDRARGAVGLRVAGVEPDQDADRYGEVQGGVVVVHADDQRRDLVQRVVDGQFHVDVHAVLAPQDRLGPAHRDGLLARDGVAGQGVQAVADADQGQLGPQARTRLPVAGEPPPQRSGRRLDCAHSSALRSRRGSAVAGGFCGSRSGKPGLSAASASESAALSSCCGASGVLGPAPIAAVPGRSRFTHR